MPGTIFRKAQNKIQNLALLRRLIAELIDREEWTTLDVDVKGDAYEGLLEKNAEDVKTGPGPAPAASSTGTLACASFRSSSGPH
jgi:type I restriction enzyme M protein